MIADIVLAILSTSPIDAVRSDGSAADMAGLLVLKPAEVPTPLDGMALQTVESTCRLEGPLPMASQRVFVRQGLQKCHGILDKSEDKSEGKSLDKSSKSSLPRSLAVGKSEVLPTDHEA